jgi:hexokinase
MSEVWLMGKAREIALFFLNKYGMYSKSIDMESLTRDFMDVMNKGLAGKDGGLLMLPSYIQMDHDIEKNKPVIVLDAGGTNFRVATVLFDDNMKPVIEDYKQYAMPGSNGTLSKNEFYRTIVEYMAPVLDKSDKIGFCFSYATETLPNKDGAIVSFSKEICIREAEGTLIGESIKSFMAEMGYQHDIEMTVINDTVATLLSGISAFPDREFDTLIGLILGTGVNTAYIENQANITKLDSIRTYPGHMIINMESCEYEVPQRGIIDEQIDHKTLNPGKSIFEKMVSGKYLGTIAFELLKKAVEKEKIFSDSFHKGFKQLDRLLSEELDDFLYYPFGCNNIAGICQTDNDRAIAYHIIENIFDRAARLIIINIAGILIKTGKGKDPCKPALIIVDGSAFHRSKLFRPMIEYYAQTYLNQQLGLYCEFHKVDNGNLIGAAVSGLAK